MKEEQYMILLKILIEWSLKSKEYEMTNFIYSNFKIGIPVKLLYSLSKQNIFSSLSSFIKGHENVNIEDSSLRELFFNFQKSKYIPLKCWNNSYGYIN
jgi:hypothetical protein